MVQYITNIIVPYVERYRDVLVDETAAAVVIFHNFKGQVTSKIFCLLSLCNVWTLLFVEKVNKSWTVSLVSDQR